MAPEYPKSPDNVAANMDQETGETLGNPNEIRYITVRDLLISLHEADPNCKVLININGTLYPITPGYHQEDRMAADYLNKTGDVPAILGVGNPIT